MSHTLLGSACARIFAHDGNLAVIHLPGREFPAIAVQGDTFHTLVAQAEEILAALAAADARGDIVDGVDDLVTRLRAVRAFYEDVLRDAGIARPYTRPPDPAG
jgi:NAD(P)-dependent dehydrogenase (short-subunit alcohol dehydrogenase family)